MARLYRPTIPIEVKCRVLLRQLGEMWPDKMIEEWRPSNVNKARNLTLLHSRLVCRLAELIKCEIKELRLDHDPPLGARPIIQQGLRIAYIPDANDPEHLFYRPHGAQHAGSHDVKTRIRGDHGQYSDVALIKRERRRQRKSNPTPAQKSVEWFKELKRKRDKALRLKIKKERNKRCRR